MEHPTSPVFRATEFDPSRDRSGEWVEVHVAWKRIELSELHRKERFLPGSGWGRNAWGEFYKGESRIELCAVVPEELVEQCNLQLVYQHQVMHVLQGARPDFTRPRGWQKTGQMAYFRWMGEEM